MQGVGGVAVGGGGIGGGGPLYIYFFFYSVQEVMRGVGSGGPKGPSRWQRPPALVLVLVKNRAWSPPVPVPSGSGSVTFFTSTFTSTEVPLFQQVGKCYIWLQPYRRGL